MSHHRRAIASGRTWDNDDESDDDERRHHHKRKPRSHQHVDNWSRTQAQKAYHDDHPSRRALKTLTDDVMSKVSRHNNDPKFVDDAKADTIAIGLSNKRELLITGNLKKRLPTDSKDRTEYTKIKTLQDGTQKAKYEDYGISQEMSDMILSEVKGSSVYKKSHLSVKVVEERVNPRDNLRLPTMMDKAKDHASKHAETKMQAYCEQSGRKLHKIAVSKEPCKGCHDDLSSRGVSMIPQTPGTKQVKSRRNVLADEVEVRNKIDRNRQVEAGVHLYRNNVHMSSTAMKETMKNNVRRAAKPGGSVGLISGAVQLYKTIEDNAVEPFADGGVMNADAGRVPNILLGETYYANAAVAQGRAGFGDLASVGYSALSAGAHAEYGLNNSVGANLSVARVDGNLGPVQVGAGLNLDTHASIGVNGISASLLGMGFSFGPRMGVQTPFFDFSVTLF